MASLHHKIVFFLLFELLTLSQWNLIYSQNLFSSFFRTNSYNRYVKNPLFTRNLVPPNAHPWPSEGEYSSNSNLRPSHQQASSRSIPASKNFNNDFRLPPLNYGSFPATINGVDFASASSTASVSISAGDPGQRSSPTQPQQAIEGRSRNFDELNSSGSGNRYQNAYSEGNSRMRQNSKKLFENNSKNNNNNKNNKNPVNKYNFDAGLYMDDNIDNALGQILDSKDMDIRKPEVVYHHTSSQNPHYNHHHNQHDTSKYNQEKALNLKLEYGFKPLPATGNQLPAHPNVKIIQLPVTSNAPMTIQTTTIPTTTSTEDSGTTRGVTILSSSTGSSISTTSTEDVPTMLSLDDIYPIFEQENNSNNNDNEKHQLAATDFEPEAESSGHNNIYSFPKHSNTSVSSDTRKSKVLNAGNANEQYYSSGDFRKLVHSPLEGEQGDLHRLAFTGIESFKPDAESPIRSSLDTIIGAHFLNFNSLTNYPDITEFKSRGVDCARNGQFCEYDSTYPNDLLDAMYTEHPEEHSDFDGYRPFLQIHGLSNSNSKNTTICDSERRYIRPSVIQDINGDYSLILQSSYYFQQVPIETCLGKGKSCNLSNCTAVRTRCVQKYRTQPLISIEHHEPGSHEGHVSCPRIRLFRLPANCVCELA